MKQVRTYKIHYKNIYSNEVFTLVKATGFAEALKKFRAAYRNNEKVTGIATA